MLKVHPIQTNFSSGELSPWLLGRSDIERYFNSAEVLENFIVHPQGPIKRRRGTEGIGLTDDQDADGVVRLVKFVFSREDSVLIEMSEGRFGFYSNGAPVMNGVSPLQVVAEYISGDTLPYTADEINEVQFTQSADVIFMTHPNHRQARLSRYSSVDWRYEYLDFDYGPYMDQEPGDQDISLTIHSVVDRVTVRSTTTDFTSTAVNDLIQYNHAGQKVLGRVVTINSSSEVVVEPYEDRSLVLSKEVYSPGSYGGWDGANSVPTYGSISVGPGVTIAFSATGVITQENVGNYLRFPDAGGNYYWMMVTSSGDIPRQGAYAILASGDVLDVTIPTGYLTRKDRTITAKLQSSEAHFFDTPEPLPGIGYDFSELPGRKFRLVLGAEVVHATAVEDMTGNTGQLINVTLNRPIPISTEGNAVITNGTTSDWNKGAWYPGNYPRTVCIHEERLTFAGTAAEPQTGWMSKSADFYNYAASSENLVVTDDSAITFTVASDTVNEILWMISRQVLLVGTTGGEIKINPSGTANALSPTNTSIQNQSSYGSEAVKPLLIGKSALYLQREGVKLRQMSYDYQTDSQVSLDLTIFAEHVLKQHGGGQQLAYQLLPESMVYVRLGDGQVAALTYEADQQVYAWARQILGGDGFVESIECIPEDGTDRLYMVVRRTINENTVRTIEMLEPEFRPESSTDFTEMIFMDNYTVGGVPGSTTITGLTQFAGCEVAVMVDNGVYGNRTVDATGALVLPRLPTSRYIVGFPFTSTLKTFPLEAQAPSGTGQGKIKRIDHITVRVMDSIGFKHGATLGTLVEENFRRNTAVLAQSPEMFTGDWRVSYQNGYDTRGSVYFVQDRALPLSILALMPEVGQYQ